MANELLFYVLKNREENEASHRHYSGGVQRFINASGGEVRRIKVGDNVAIITLGYHMSRPQH